VYIDVHNHVIPDAVLRLGEQDSRLGISASDGMFRSPHHVPFPLLPAFHSPQEKVADRKSGPVAVTTRPGAVRVRPGHGRAVGPVRGQQRGNGRFCAHAPTPALAGQPPMQAPGGRRHAEAVAVSAGRGDRHIDRTAA
jgi:hypothetical protein